MKQLLSAGLVALSLGGVADCHTPLAGGSFRVENEGASLAATLLVPERETPVPALVFVHGSGRTTRDQQRIEAERFRALGFAVAIYDKRGVGESTGDYDNVGVRTSPQRMPLLARDALAVLRAVRSRRGIDPARVGFYGVSQAGWIVPAAIAAAGHGEVAFAVIKSGPAGSVGQEDAYSKLTGDGFRPHEALTAAEIDARVDAFNGPPGFDNLPALARLSVPVLWLLGEADESIPVHQTRRNLEALRAAGKPITIVSYPDANHGLFTPAGPAPFWADVGRWLRSQRLID